MEDDDEIELKLVDELEIAKSVNDQQPVAENTPAKKILKQTTIFIFFCILVGVHTLNEIITQNYSIKHPKI